MNRAAYVILGIISGALIFAPLGFYLYARSGGIDMATTAKPLPFEETLADAALHASIGDAAKIQNPLPLNDQNLMAGAQVFVQNCAICHGLPGRPKSDIAAGEFPQPPQLFEPKEMVSNDPQGVTYWKVTHGIRLSGMPGFASTLSDTERWQVTMLVAHANSLPPDVNAELSKAAPTIDANQRP